MDAPPRSLWDGKGVATLLLLMFLLPLGMGLVQPPELPLQVAPSATGESDRTELSRQDQAVEMIMMGLRISEGISLDRLNMLKVKILSDSV